MAIDITTPKIESLAEEAYLYDPRRSFIDGSYDMPRVVPVAE